MYEWKERMRMSQRLDVRRRSDVRGSGGRTVLRGGNGRVCACCRINNVNGNRINDLRPTLVVELNSPSVTPLFFF
jgi:hypothetical protein